MSITTCASACHPRFAAVVLCGCLASTCGHADDATPSFPTGGEVPYFWPLSQTLAQDPPPAMVSQFGAAVDISGDLLVIGAPHAYADGIDTGAAYVYRRIDDAWQLETVLAPADAQHGALFGFSVAVADTPEREFVVVGEPFRDDGADADAGRLTIYERAGGSWQNVSQVPGGDHYKALGYAVDTDGASVLVGAPYTNAFYGATVTLRREASGPAWVVDHETLPDPADEIAGYYGFSVAIAGPYALTGARAARLAGEPVGAAEISNLFAGGALSQRVIVHAPSPVPLDEFGWSVAASGAVFAIGASAADESSQMQNSGAVFVYRLAGQALTFEKKFTARYPQQNAYFGTSVAFAGDLLAVGEPQRATFLISSHAFAGAVSLFRRAALQNFGIWNRETTLYNLVSNERMGTSVAVDGTRAVAGVPQRGSGAVQVHVRDVIFADDFEDIAPE